jgi:hypothetical protein
MRTRTNRLGFWAAAAFLGLFLAVALAGSAQYYGYGTNFALDIFLIFLVLAFLVAAGNLLYGRNSHYARAQDRVRPAQQAHDRAADEANAARHASAPAPASAPVPTPEDSPPHA